MKKSLLIVGIIALIFISPKVYGYVRNCQNAYEVKPSKQDICEADYNCGKPDCNIHEYHEHKTYDYEEYNQEINHHKNRHHSSHHSN